MITRAVLVDSGPLFALSVKSDQYNSRAEEELNELNRGGYSLIVLYTTIFETFSLIQRKHGSHKATNWLQFADDSYNLINPHKVDLDGAVSKLMRYPDQSLSLFDALTVVVANKISLFVWTFDHHFEIMQSPIWRKGQI